MPNHVRNRLVVLAETERVKEVFNALKSDDRVIDFNNIIPMPKDVYRGDISFSETNDFVNWYDWSVENWGTKWNAYSDSYSNDNTIEFDTAWSCVADLMFVMSAMFPDVKFEYSYADENIGWNVGRVTMQNGELIDEYEPKWDSKEAYELAFDIRPEYREDYELVDGRYEFKEQ